MSHSSVTSRLRIFGAVRTHPFGIKSMLTSTLPFGVRYVIWQLRVKEVPTTTFLVQCFALIIWAIPHFLTTTIPLSFRGSFRPIGSVSLSPKLYSRAFGLKLEEISTGNNSSHPSGTSTATFHHAAPTFVTHSYCASVPIKFRTPAINSTEFEHICGLHHFSPALRRASFNSIMRSRLRPFAATADDLGTNGSRPAGNKAPIMIQIPRAITAVPQNMG